jgi:hypothetical protein
MAQQHGSFNDSFYLSTSSHIGLGPYGFGLLYSQPSHSVF